MNLIRVEGWSQSQRRGVILAGALCLIIVFAAWWIIPKESGATINFVQLDLSKETGQVASLDNRRPLRIAVGAMISPKSTYVIYEGLLRRVGELLDRPVEVVQRASYREVNDLVERRAVDVAYVCSGPYVSGHKKFGMELLAAPVAHGEQLYYSYIIVHRDGSIKSFDELRGKTFAFTDKDSNSGCLVPTYILARRGETPQSFFGDIFYSRSHDNSIEAVARKRATGAAVDSLIWEYKSKLDPVLTSQTRILMKSPPYGIPPLVVHPAMPEAEKNRLRQVFLTLHLDNVAREHLQRIQIDRFGLVRDEQYNSVREMQDWLDKGKD
jgi:phosphonate transport system substrate-binding protein